jgi:hypothetical protein
VYFLANEDDDDVCKTVATTEFCHPNGKRRRLQIKSRLISYDRPDVIYELYHFWRLNKESKFWNYDMTEFDTLEEANVVYDRVYQSSILKGYVERGRFIRIFFNE